MKRVLPVLLSILFALALLEGALQLVYRVRAGDWLAHRTALPIYRETDSGFALKPHLALEHRTGEFRTHLFTDAHGFRVAAAGDEVARDKPECAWRVMLLGPSFAFGWGVEYEETFLAQLGDRLRAAAASGGAGGAAGDAKIDLINAGVPALGPIQQLEWFRREGAAYRPDLVIQLVYGSYAVSRAYSDGLVPDERGYLRPATVSRADRLRAALKRSAIVFHVWAATNRLRGGEPKAIEGAGRPIATEEDPAEVGEALAFYEDLRTTVEAAGAELLVVYLPLSWRVHPEDTARWRHLGVIDPEASAASDAAWRERLARADVPVLDLTDALLAEAAKGERLYYSVDIHWTPKGHGVAAREIAGRMLEQH